VNTDDAARLLARYADTLDDWRLEDWADLFADDGTYEIVPRENLDGLGDGERALALVSCPDRRFIDDRVKAIRNATLYGPQRYRHLYGTVVADELGDGRTALRASYAVYRTLLSGESDLFSVGTVEAVVDDGPPPRFSSMRVVCDTSLVAGYLVLPL
jgi:anthranilate 1,2-dioxygenase small subunit